MLRVDDLAVSYASVPALHRVAFHVDAGEIVAIIGSNGAGKTTTLKAISGLLRPDRGAITFLDERLDHLPAHAIAQRRIAHVPEGRKLFGRLTVEQNLAIGAYIDVDETAKQTAREQVFALFPRLSERRNQRAATLSGGEQQMLAIGRGLMLRPKLLMLDEPSLGIAPKIVDQIFASIKEINTGGMTVLLVEQNVHEALEIAHRAYVMQTGVTTMEGTGVELLNSDLVRQAYLGL